jgi:preprotein translocase subunit Sec63
MLQAFKKWHDRAWELIGQVALTSVYQVCYGVSWQTVENLLNPIDLIYIKTTQPWWQVLGVKKSAKSFQVETAYKRLIRIWHPDLNKSPYATEVTSRLNVAYQEYRLLQKKTTHKRDIKLDSQLFIRLQSFFKPLFSR